MAFDFVQGGSSAKQVLASYKSNYSGSICHHAAQFLPEPAQRHSVIKSFMPEQRKGDFGRVQGWSINRNGLSSHTPARRERCPGARFLHREGIQETKQSAGDEQYTAPDSGPLPVRDLAVSFSRPVNAPALPGSRKVKCPGSGRVSWKITDEKRLTN